MFIKKIFIEFLSVKLVLIHLRILQGLQVDGHQIGIYKCLEWLKPVLILCRILQCHPVNGHTNVIYLHLNWLKTSSDGFAHTAMLTSKMS
jgi:hypothetical protein